MSERSPHLNGAASTTNAPRLLLAAAIAGGDVSPAGMTRFGGASTTQAKIAFAQCCADGLVSEDGAVDDDVATSLIADLPVERAAEIRAKAARHWMANGPDHLLAALEQARAAGILMPLDELVDLADRGGRMSLSLLDYKSAAELLKLSVELDSAGDPIEMGRRMCDLATAVDGLGDVVEARALLARAAALAELAGDVDLMVTASVAHTLPVDWYAGDKRSAGLLTRASALNLSCDQRTLVQAARALVEMRIPVSSTDEHQVSWVTRATVAHALADDALASSVGRGPNVRGFATLAWRTVHRAPATLAQRREISKESLDLAQLLRIPSSQVESAVWLASDAIESADRPLFDEALSVARWVADRDGNPRLVWRAHTLSCGAAHLDGDIEEAERWRSLAREVGESVSSPGWLAADLLFYAETVIAKQDEEMMQRSLLPEDFPALANPIGRLTAAFIHASVGNKDIAMRMARRALRQLDPEASYLLLATRCAAVNEILRDKELAQQLIKILDPWRGHVSVDSNSWWCDGPVDLALAAMHNIVGDFDQALVELNAAEITALSMNDARALARSAALRKELGSNGTPNRMTVLDASTQQLVSNRQIQVLRLMSLGLTNREIAEILAFSASTIRVESIAIYRALGVKSRAEAVARASSLGLVTIP